MMQGGPLMHAVAAKAVALKECATPEYQAYARQVIANSQALTAALEAEGMRAVSGGTDTHLALLDLQGIGVTGAEAEARSDAARIVLNKNAIPYDPQPPSIASGIRVGTPAMTTQGMDEGDMKVIASLIGRAVRDADGSAGGRRSRPRSTTWSRPSRRTPPRTPVVREYLLCLFVAAVGDLPGRPRWCGASPSGWGAMAEVRDRDVHDEPTPRLGGLAMFAGLLAALLVGQPAAAPAARCSSDSHRADGAAVTGALVLVLLGMVDDRGASTRPPSSPARRSPARSWRCRGSRSCGCPSAARSCSTR